jgi:hypothetical protein
MRLVNVDKLYPDVLTKHGALAISQGQLAYAETIQAIPLNVIDEIKAEIINESNKAFHAPNWGKARGLDLARDIIEEKVKEYKHG